MNKEISNNLEPFFNSTVSLACKQNDPLILIDSLGLTIESFMRVVEKITNLDTSKEPLELYNESSLYKVKIERVKDAATDKQDLS